jgi:hypothetical protein
MMILTIHKNSDIIDTEDTKMTDTVRKGREGKLSAIIDPLLFEGGRRINAIAEHIVSQSNGQYTKRQVVNNIRSRMNVFVKRGYVIERDVTDRRLVRLVAPVALEASLPANV